MTKNLICAASFSAIDLDMILDAKGARDIWSAHRDIATLTEFKERAAKLIPYEVSLTEILERKSPKTTVRLFKRTDGHIEIALIIEETAMFLCGHLDTASQTFVADSDTCAQDYEEPAGTELSLHIINSVRFFIETQ